MRLNLVCFASGALALLVPGSASAEKGDPLSETMPWIVSLGDDGPASEIERRYGIDPNAVEFEPYWEGDMLFDRNSATQSMLEQGGVSPLHAEGYDASPGILYVEMGGVTLTPTCSNGDQVNAALNCSPLVEAQTTFPAYGDDGARAAVFNQLATYYEPFNIVMTTARPPDWVPYTMSVVGGSAGLAGQPGGVCGVANVQCDGLKRNHVSLSFPDSCPGDVAEIAAQETSHNWGLEHTNVESDLMYPFTNGGFKTFVDDCMAISHATGSGETQCGYVHSIHCPGGEGEQQNSYAELMGVFGPRVLDEEPPEILTIEPADGAAFSTTDSIAVRGTVAENTNFIALKWTLEGGPEPFTKCTNNVCDQDYELGTGFDPNGETIEFTGLNQAPEGIYTVTFEVMDAYGLYDSQTITFSVTEDGMPPMTTGVTDPTGSGSDTDATASGTTDGETSGASNNDDDDDDDDGDTDTDAGIDDGSKGCNCGTGGGAGGLALLVLGAAIRRRKRSS